MQEMVLISEVSNLSREVNKEKYVPGALARGGDDANAPWGLSSSLMRPHGSSDADELNLHASRKMQIDQLLGEWEEPEVPPSARKVSIC